MIYWSSMQGDLGQTRWWGCGTDASEVVSSGSATEVLCYGTAVVIEKAR